MSIQVGQEVKAVSGMEKGKVGTVVEIGSGVYEGFLKVVYPYWGDCWISAINGEEATWEEAVIEAVEEASSKVEEVVSPELERNRNLPASGFGISLKEAALRLSMSVEEVKRMVDNGQFKSAYREESLAHEGLQDWVSPKEVYTMQQAKGMFVQPPNSFYH